MIDKTPEALMGALESCSLAVGEPEQAQAAALLRSQHQRIEALEALLRRYVRQDELCGVVSNNLYKTSSALLSTTQQEDSQA